MVDALEGLHALQVWPFGMAALPQHIVVRAAGGDLDWRGAGK